MSGESNADFNVLRVNELHFGDACMMYLTKGTSGLMDRLGIKFFNGAAELEMEPGEQFDEKGRVISQIQLMGKVIRTLGREAWRRRVDITILNDVNGGEAVYFGSTLTENAPKDELAMPMVYRIQHDTNQQPDVDIIIHGDKTLELKTYNPDGTARGTRLPVRTFVDAVRRVVRVDPI